MRHIFLQFLSLKSTSQYLASNCFVFMCVCVCEIQIINVFVFRRCKQTNLRKYEVKKRIHDQQSEKLQHEI